MLNLAYDLFIIISDPKTKTEINGIKISIIIKLNKN